MKYNLYTTSKKAWDASIKALKQAKKSIYIEMYIFLDDTTDSHDFIGLLKKKAKEGLEVVIIADAFGSLNLKKQTIKDFRSAGIEILFFSHFWRRTHRKIIIIDNQTAFIGGVNIEKKTINWKDIQIKLSGRKTVKAILRSFAYVYQMCGGKNKHIIKQYHRTIIKKIKSLILENFPGHNSYSLLEYYRDKIISAEKNIKIVTPYFIPPRWLIALLDDARRRGVEIEIIIPKKTDVKIMNKINYFYINQLSPWGIKFYADSKMNHSKILIIDKREILIGSQNIDFLSFGRNFEVGVFSRQKKMVKELEKIFNKWKNRSTSFNSLKIKLNCWDKIKIKITMIFFSII